MGRRRSVNRGLPQHMYKRVTKSGKVYFYYDRSHNGKRKRIPLGSDFLQAVMRYGHLTVEDEAALLNEKKR